MTIEFAPPKQRDLRDAWKEVVESIGLQDLQLGDASFAVKSLQIALQGLGLLPGPVTGKFTIETQQAIICLQQQFGIPTTGIFDSATWYVLNFKADLDLDGVACMLELAA